MCAASCFESSSRFLFLQETERFFEDASHYDDSLSFQDMNLSRPLLKVLHCFSLCTMS